MTTTEEEAEDAFDAPRESVEDEARSRDTGDSGRMDNITTEGRELDQRLLWSRHR